jgi:hypothetical protein
VEDLICCFKEHSIICYSWLGRIQVVIDAIEKGGLAVAYRPSFFQLFESTLVWGTDIPRVHSGRKLRPRPHDSCPSVTSRRGPGKWKRWKRADLGTQWAHARTNRGLGMTVLRPFVFLHPTSSNARDSSERRHRVFLGTVKVVCY